jgi:hypothetical protein
MRSWLAWIVAMFDEALDWVAEAEPQPESTTGG